MTPLAMTLSNIQRDLSTLLSPARYSHCERVAIECITLAQHWNLNQHDAELASWIHDAAKELTPKSFAKTGLPNPTHLNSIYRDFPTLWHAFAGPIIAEKKWNINDPTILEAAKWHTTGTATLSPLAEILFIADFIEPKRTHPYITLVKSLAKTDRALAITAIQMVNIPYIVHHGLPVFPDTLECYNAYLKKCATKSLRTLKEKLTTITHEAPHQTF